MSYILLTRVKNNKKRRKYDYKNINKKKTRESLEPRLYFWREEAGNKELQQHSIAINLFLQ